MAHINPGDVISIGGIHEDYDEKKPLRQWRCESVEDDQIILTPLHADGTVDEFNAMAGDFRIVRK